MDVRRCHTVSAQGPQKLSSSEKAQRCDHAPPHPLTALKGTRLLSHVVRFSFLTLVLHNYPSTIPIIYPNYYISNSINQHVIMKE